MLRNRSLGYYTAIVSATALAGGAVSDMIAEKPILATFAAVSSLTVGLGTYYLRRLEIRMRNCNTAPPTPPLS